MSHRSSVGWGLSVRLASIAVLCLFGAASAQAHSHLESASPPADAVLESSPTEVTLHFNEALEPRFSSLKIVGHDKTAVPTGATTVPAGDAQAMRLALPPLAAGAYEVQWTAVGHDGHRVKGSYGFSVK